MWTLSPVLINFVPLTRVGKQKEVQGAKLAIRHKSIGAKSGLLLLQWFGSVASCSTLPAPRSATRLPLELADLVVAM